MAKTLDGKIAVITGAARGIGSAIAKRFAAEGASVVINYLTRKDEAEQTMSAIESGGGTALTRFGKSSLGEFSTPFFARRPRNDLSLILFQEPLGLASRTKLTESRRYGLAEG